MKDKKVLTPQQVRQKKKLLVYPLMIAVFLGVIWLIFAPENTGDKELSGLKTDIPVTEKDKIIGDKKTAFEREQFQKREEQKMRALQSYEFSLTDGNQVEKEEVVIKTDEAVPAPSKPVTSGYSPIKTSSDVYWNMNRQLQSFYESPKNDPEKEALRQKVKELSKQLENQNSMTSPENRQMELMEKSYQLASRYLVSNQIPSQPAKVLPEKSISTNEKTEVNAVRSVSESVVSRLDQPMTDTAFIREYSKTRNYTFSTAVGVGKFIDRNTIKACVYMDQVLIFGENSEAQYVYLRLMEAIQAGNTIIPRNSLISGIARLQGNRLEILIENLQYKGKIIPVKLLVYDTDGQAGIHAPGSVERSAAKEAGANIGSGLGNSVSFTHSAGQQVAMDVSRGVMQAGSQYLASKIKMVKVRLKANYNVLLLTDRN